jgi:pilus assembly protein Flp/PilA
MFRKLASLMRFVASEDGPTAVEYAVMLALIVVVCIAILQSLGTGISGTFSSVQSTVTGS